MITIFQPGIRPELRWGSLSIPKTPKLVGWTCWPLPRTPLPLSALRASLPRPIFFWHSQFPFFLKKICLAATAQMIDLFSVTSCMLRVVLQVVRHSNTDHTNSVELGDDSCMHVIRSASWFLHIIALKFHQTDRLAVFDFQGCFPTVYNSAFSYY